MITQTFPEYLSASFSSKNSRAYPSYIQAIKIMDEIFSENDKFNLGNKSLSEIKDPHLIALIIEYILEEEHKYKKGLPSFFDSVRDGQKSYVKGGFCKAAIKKIGEYVNIICRKEVTDMIGKSRENGKNLSKKLSKRFHINNKGTEKEVRAKRRVGQDIFRAILLEIYDSKCCLTGIEIPEVLRASHIILYLGLNAKLELDLIQLMGYV